MAPKINEDFICGEHIAFVRQIEQVCAKVDSHSDILVRMESKIDTLLTRQPDRSDDPPAGKLPLWVKVGAAIGAGVASAAAYFGIGGA